MQHRLGKHDAKWKTLAELKENGEYLGNTRSGCGKQSMGLRNMMRTWETLCPPEEHGMDLKNMMRTWETLCRLKERKENLGNVAQTWKT